MDFNFVSVHCSYVIVCPSRSLYWRGYRGSRSCHHDPWTFDRSSARVYNTFAAASAACASIKSSFPLVVVPFVLSV